MSTEKMREEFEAWQCNADDGPQTDPMWMHRVEGGNGAYGINEVQRDWVTWQACRAAAEVDLSRCEELCSQSVGSETDTVLAEAQKAIQAAGIKVKP